MKPKTKPAAKGWMETAWPEGKAAFDNLYDTVHQKGVLDAKTRRLIALACVSLLRCRHCVEANLRRLREEAGASEREIAEAMMIASLTAAGTNLAWAKECFEDRPK